MNHTAFQNKVAVITGGAGVLCSEFAKALARHGAKVAVADYAVDRAQGVADAIRREGGEAIAVNMNVLEAESIRSAYAEVKAAFGPLRYPDQRSRRQSSVRHL